MTSPDSMKTLAEAIEYTGYKEATLRWRRSRNLPPISRKLAGKVVYLTSDLDAWRNDELNKQTRGSTA